MNGKFIAYVFSLFTFFYIVLISISFYTYLSLKERVNDVCYNAAETVSTRAVLSDELYDSIRYDMSCCGDISLNFILEQNNKSHTSTLLYGYEQIKNLPLKRGDKLTITATDMNPSLFEKFTGAKLQISAVKTAIIN